MSEPTPVAVRATDVTRQHRTRILRRTVVRTYNTFDARYADGTVRTDVDLDAVLKGSDYPADYWSTYHGARAAIGQWVDYPYGHPLPA